MTDAYYSIGTTLANMQNIETAYGMLANTKDTEGIALLPPGKERVASGALVRNGAISTGLAFSLVTAEQLRAFTYGVFGGLTTASASVFITAIDEYSRYSPFAVTIDRPYVEDYELENNVWRRQMIVPCYGWALQEVTKTGNATLTTSERLVNGDTSGGNITLTLPVASAPEPDTVFSIVKTAAANTLTVDGNGSEAIDGSATIALTAAFERLDMVSNGNGWVRI